MALFNGKLFSTALLLGRIFGFTTEIIVTPIVRPDTGGGIPNWYPDLEEYRVTIRITRNGKKWEQSFEANRFQLSTLEKVLITFKSITKVLHNINILVTPIGINIKKIWVNIRK